MRKLNIGDTIQIVYVGHANGVHCKEREKNTGAFACPTPPSASVLYPVSESLNTSRNDLAVFIFQDYHLFDSLCLAIL